MNTHSDRPLEQPGAGIEIALYQPDIPGNCGTILRMAACMGCRVHVIEPAGFRLDDRSLKRAGMDYLEMAALMRHSSWEVFIAEMGTEGRNLVLLTTKAETPYYRKHFRSRDVLLFGSESHGVPEAVHQQIDERLTVPMPGGGRSLNLAVSVAMVTGEAMRQLNFGAADA